MPEIPASPLPPYSVVGKDGRVYPSPFTKRQICLYGQFSPEYIDEEIASGRLRAFVFSDDDIRVCWPDLSEWLFSKANRPREAPKPKRSRKPEAVTP
jgi:hypothetical protein